MLDFYSKETNKQDTEIITKQSENSDFKMDANMESMIPKDLSDEIVKSIKSSNLIGATIKNNGLPLFKPNEWTHIHLFQRSEASYYYMNKGQPELGKVLLCRIKQVYDSLLLIFFARILALLNSYYFKYYIYSSLFT